MKVWGESIFDVVYLIIAITLGIIMIRKSDKKLGKMMGYASLILGCGDAFHLVPRVLNYFVDYDWNLYLGVGKFVTSITMTFFYILMYYIYLNNYKVKEDKKVTMLVWGLAIVRIALCLFPQNNWFTNNSPLLWGVLRNIPFAILGALIVFLYFKVRSKDKALRFVYLFVTFSFLFYIPVVLWAESVPIIGMLMLPKTVCYVFVILAFRKKLKA